MDMHQLSIDSILIRLGIITISFTFSVSVNLINIQYIKNNYKGDNVNTKSLVYGGTIYSIDNQWYIDPAINFIEKGVYAKDVSNSLTKYRRTPGYPIYYGLHYFLLGEKGAHRVIGFTQSILFAISSLLLGLGVYHFSRNNFLAILTSLMYSLCPFIAGYTFFTITEAIHPAFVIIAFYFLAKYYRYRHTSAAFLCGMFLALSAMIRPTNILFIIPVGLVLAMTFFGNKQIKAVLCVVMGVVIVIAPWTCRNYTVSKEFIPLEKFSHESSMGMGRSQTYLSRWWMCFDNPHPESLVSSMIQDLNKTGKEKYSNIDFFLKGLPSYAFSGSSEQEVRKVLIKMQDCYETKAKMYGTPIKILSPSDSEASCEFTCKEDFELLIQKYKINNPIRYYIVAPYFTRAKEFILQSFSSMYASLNPESRDFSFMQKCCKSIMYLLNVTLFISVIWSLFIGKYTMLRLVSLSYIVTTIFLLVNITHIETRYLLSAYPFMYILLALSITEIGNRSIAFKNRIKKSASAHVCW